ncbi:DUF4136 domain-containing protein [Aurantibacter crassamenti]|uniref:DUF4136 domain-containing protein n=1 Tax=Aurantibacter crassamenti TaxID=1837375 RepID=UPI00193A1CBF|nr:DUF4136 domain-containing protein [Aurantibacter crassamenti]MBM1106086.1 DUF4136 domain-containing protein [Aurantibacter crassamenti]
MRLILSFFLLVLCTSCGATKVNYDFDKDTDFTNYTTYNYYSDLNTGLSELDEKRLLNIMDITLQIKGMVYSEEPDFLINITSESFQAPQNSSIGVGVGSGGRNIGGGVSVGIPVGQNKLQRKIRFDFVDAKRDQLFWQANCQNTYKENVPPAIREENLAELVDKMLSKYPPKSSK